MATRPKKRKPNRKADIPVTKASGNVNPGDTATSASETTQTDDSTQNLLAQLNSAWTFFAPVRRTWWDRERLLLAQVADSFSRKSTRSKVTDAHISTLAFERQARIAAQLPTGKIYALESDEDAEQASALMNLVLNKYILPNANSQFDALTKLRLSGVYASVYGAQPILYDYRIDDEYIGPDFWLIPIRNFIPQPNKNSIRDCDWVYISTLVSLDYLENIATRQNTKWNKANVNKLIELVKSGPSPSRDLDSQKRSEAENERVLGTPIASTDRSARVELVTKYEKGKKGRWITFARDFKDVGMLRDIANPHNNGRIPVVMRQCFPLIDSIWGLGDFERGITLQKAKDSLINLYLDGVKLSIFPPLKIDTANATMSTIRIQAGARWFMKDPNAVMPFETSANGLQTFEGTYQFLTGALLNQFGAMGDNSVSKQDSGNAQVGKTPAAIDAAQQREGARDNWDRFMLERMLEDLLGGVINLLAENQEKPINFHIFDHDVERIVQEFGELDKAAQSVGVQALNPPKYMKMVGSSTAKMTLPKSLLARKYHYIIDGSSTLLQDDEKENQTLMDLLGFYFKGKQYVDEALAQDGYQFNAGEAIKKMVYTLGVQDPDAIISEIANGPGGAGGSSIDPEQIAGQFQDQDIQNTVRQMFGGQGQQAPQSQPMPPAQPAPAPAGMPQPTQPMPGGMP